MTRTIRIMASMVAGLLIGAPGLRSGNLNQVTKGLTKNPQTQEIPPLPKADATHRTIEVPLVYGRPDRGTFRLYYETNSDFHPEWRTLFMLHDGQQQPNIAGDPDRIKKDYGLERINVVRMEHRGMPWSRIERVFTKTGVDWQKAWECFRSVNVVEDIDRIRVDLLGEDGSIFLVGGSGAGVLACQYLAKYAAHVDRALIYVASDNLPSANRRVREKFFDLLEAEGMTDSYRKVLDGGSVPQGQFLWILQRLGYEYLPSERKEIELIQTLAAGDRSLYERYAEEYQDVLKIVEIINRLTPFSAVRIFELSSGTLDLTPPDPSLGLVRPLTRTLSELTKAGIIKPEPINVRPALAAIPTEVVLATARWDHVMPYEEMVEMHKNMPQSRLLLIDDLHTMKKAKAGLLKLAPIFFEHGAFSPEFEAALESGICPIWKGPDHP